jgi:putative endonuclease
MALGMGKSPRLDLVRRISKKFDWLRSLFHRWFHRGGPEHLKLGRVGESLAVCHLKRNGFSILERNWVYDKGEIDIIAFDRKNRLLVFVEVKLRYADALTPGYFAVNAKKKRTLLRTCRAYLRKCTTSDVCYRFDIIEVKRDRSDGSHKIFHYENVKLF